MGQNWYPVGVSGLETFLVRFLLKNASNDGVKSEIGAIFPQTKGGTTGVGFLLGFYRITFVGQDFPSPGYLSQGVDQDFPSPGYLSQGT